MCKASDEIILHRDISALPINNQSDWFFEDELSWWPGLAK